MIQLQLQPELEAQLAAEAEARGLSLDLYLEGIVRARAVEEAEALSTRSDRAAKLDRFLEQMATHSEHIPPQAGATFTRESIYEDRD